MKISSRVTVSAHEQAAAELGISLGTVRTHVRSIYGKLHVHSATQAVRRALEEGLV